MTRRGSSHVQSHLRHERRGVIRKSLEEDDDTQGLSSDDLVKKIERDMKSGYNKERHKYHRHK